MLLPSALYPLVHTAALLVCNGPPLLGAVMLMWGWGESYNGCMSAYLPTYICLSLSVLFV